MPLSRLALLAVAALLWAGCADDDDTGVGDLPGPPLGQTESDEPDDGGFDRDVQGTLGEPVVYRGAEDTDAPWELTVVARDVECDVDIGDEVEAEPAEDRFCVVHLELENTGGEANVAEFTESSSVVVDDGSSHPVEEIATSIYAEDRGRELVAVAPGETAERALVFSVPDGTEPTHLQLQAAASDELVVIDLSGT
jgi:hypothetical protein